MKRRYMVVILLMMLMLTSCNSDDPIGDKMIVAVSIVPQATFVEAVAGDLVEVVTLIPSGASPANYQPSPKEMSAFSKAEIYFTIGVGSEEASILPDVVTQNERVVIVDLAEAVDDIYEARYFEDEQYHDEGEAAIDDDHNHEGRDPHIWMSPKRVMVMVEGIRDALIEADQVNEDLYVKNAAEYMNKLVTLDQGLSQKLTDQINREFIVMHPSLGYFADDYGLEMIAIEEDGKEAGVQHLQKVIEEAKTHKIHVVFYQQEFDSSQAETIAKEIEGEVQVYEPLSGDYIEMMNALGNAFTEALQGK